VKTPVVLLTGYLGSGKTTLLSRLLAHAEMGETAVIVNELGEVAIEEACRRVLRHPTVARKTFLVSIGDRTVGGLCSRDPFVGPWQVPVADCATTLSGFQGYGGEAFAVGERTPLALISPEASGRMAVGEALTNLAAARIGELARVKLSANWMAAAGMPQYRDKSSRRMPRATPKRIRSRSWQYRWRRACSSGLSNATQRSQSPAGQSSEARQTWTSSPGSASAR